MVDDAQLKFMEFYKGAKPFNVKNNFSTNVSGTITIGTFMNTNNLEFKKNESK